MSRVKLDYRGFLALRQSAEALDAINAEAEALAARANANKRDELAEYEARPAVTVPHGSVALVATANTRARDDNAEAHTLERSM